MTDQRYCSDLSLAAGEAMIGTADRVDVWLLLEYKSVWRAKAVTDNELPAAMQTWLQRQIDGLAEQGLKARPQLIRQRGTAVDATRLFIGWDEGLYRFDAADLDAIGELDLVNEVGEGVSGAFSTVEEACYFVCTNGQRDLCCARYGLPTYARLRELVGDRVWQTTHLGGHRFAPNVLALPQGVLYGRVVVQDVPDFVACVEDGRLSKPHVRGRSAFPPEAQAAEALLDERIVELLECTEGRVSVRTATGERSIAVGLGPKMDVVASCGDEETKQIQPFDGQLRRG